ncbi:hypothetical protein CC80DRAFT_516365 [Byssothecium circinans]|uniref:BHLH domain-containing protein n=1 Tax=Byssothecium circinans TaxID=147558 RepID=A0A6A5U4N5_9PLEO|nr:hypothetical protein CC80DRAFT_516365 [Byssothecium circinans]
MPRPTFPPTPAPSTDITGKQNVNAPQFDSSFALPPAAITASTRRSAETSSSTSSNASDSSYRPLSPPSPIATSKNASASRKRSSAGQNVITPNDYSLPPPPTRSRKIIQMKPKESQEKHIKTSSAASTANTTPATTTGGKRKQSGGTTAAGRKIARKTAHSLIERRRRSKMNEEFGVLKDMIPACAGQDMHKLAILQASIEYMRYLQRCVDELKEAHRSSKPIPSEISFPQINQTPPNHNTIIEDNEEDENEEEDLDDDEEMTDAVSPKHTTIAPTTTDAIPNSTPTYRFPSTSPTMHPSDRSVHSITTSPNIYPADSHARNYSATMSNSPALQPSDPHHYSLGGSSIRSTATSPSIQASPAFGGQTPSQPFHSPFPTAWSSKNSVSGPSSAHFALTSPALGPQADREDHEATEALLMLNTDRRSWAGDRGAVGRSMSVRDLLSG